MASNPGSQSVTRGGGLDDLRAKSIALVDTYSFEVTGFLESGEREQAIERAKAYVANTLRDPESAQFRNVRIVPHKLGSVICGEVNGKNTYGGYVGFTRFVSGFTGASFERTGGKYVEIDRAANAGLNITCRPPKPQPRF